MIVDIRDRTQWMSNGIKGSICIPLRDIPNHIDDLKKYDEVVFVCYSGLHSRKLVHKYSDVLNCKAETLSTFRK